MEFLAVSCRQNRTSTLYFSASNVAFRQSGESVSPVELDALTRGKRVCILVHGYRSAVDDIWGAYEQVRVQMVIHGLHQYYDTLIYYLWPGGWAKLSYWPANQRADTANHMLGDLLDQIGNAAAIDVQTHSLGARLPFGLTGVRNLFLLAPAVTRDAVKEYRAGNTYVMFSRQDKVLGIWYRLATFGRYALGYCGAKEFSGTLHGMNCTPIVDEHSGYRQRSEVYQYWEEQLQATGKQ